MVYDSDIDKHNAENEMQTLKQVADAKLALTNVAGYFKLIVTMPNGTQRVYWDLPTRTAAEMADAQIGYITKRREIVIQ